MLHAEIGWIAEREGKRRIEGAPGRTGAEGSDGKTREELEDRGSKGK
jgi:hypothetical protein